MKEKVKETSTKNLVEVISSLSEEEKKQAYAMLQGMLLGKELANNQKVS